MKLLLLPALLLCLSTAASAQTITSSDPVVTTTDRKESFGAVLMPPALPQGATAAYGYVGAQDVGGGYRQGIDLMEFEGRARFNWLLLSVHAEGVAKYRLLQRDRMEIAPSVALGFGYSSGSVYLDARNFRGLLLHVEPGITAAYRIHDTLRGFAQVLVPIDFGLAPAGGYRVLPLAGGGVEFYLGDDLSVMGMAGIGPDVMREPNGFAQWRIGYTVKIGIGYRIF